MHINTPATERRKANERRAKLDRRRIRVIKGVRPARDPDFLDWMATQPCCVTGEWDATTHHVRFCGSPKNDRRTIRLVARLHMRTHEKPGQPCIERIGKAAFEKRYGISIEAEIAKCHERYENERAAC
jgi:hypothetical protein